jgi:methylated-DNA-[protein]-cysteine S-methyltransferase
VTTPTTDELLSALRAYEPVVTPPELAGGDLRYVIEDTVLGPVLLTVRSEGELLTSSFVLDEASSDVHLDRLSRLISPRVLRGGRALDPIRRQLAEYLSGRRRVFEVAVDPVLATPFQRLVLGQLVSGVGYGTTTSYGTLAVAVGRPGSARAVGAALGANPLCIVLPCHRVIGATGELTGYAGGVEAKRYLLDLERRHGEPAR